MATTLLGDTVNYIPVESLYQRPKAAIIIGVHEDGSADLRVFNGFTEGTTDVEHVQQTVAAKPGYFYYNRGSKGAATLNMPLNNSTDTTVALADANPFVAAGDNILIDQEYMTVTDATDLNNLKVTRAVGGSTIAAHAAGAVVKIGVPLPA